MIRVYLILRNMRSTVIEIFTFQLGWNLFLDGVSWESGAIKTYGYMFFQISKDYITALAYQR